MKILFIAAMAASLLMGCNHFIGQKDPPGQWILESYNSEKGYVFRKDGVRYEAHCGAVIWTKTDGDWDINEKVSESGCAVILPFLHMIVPLKPGGKPDVVHFDKQDPGIKWTYAFKITEAK
jgi:hypothetical protein